MQMFQHTHAVNAILPARLALEQLLTVLLVHCLDIYSHLIINAQLPVISINSRRIPLFLVLVVIVPALLALGLRQCSAFHAVELSS